MLTVAVFRNLAPILPDTVKLPVAAFQAFCVVNEAEPVVLSTNAPRITFDAAGITTVPVNWLVSPYITPFLTFDVDGYPVTDPDVYNILVPPNVSVSNVQVGVEPDMSWRF